MNHVFTVWKSGQLITVNQFDLIPETFDFLVEFRPVIPPEPHSHEQHQEIDHWQIKFAELMKKEQSCQQ